MTTHETQPTEPPPVTCIVLNYNGWRDTVPCVESLRAQDYPSLSIVVVDNASTDDSVRQITAAHPDVELLHAEHNGGFASGNNLGIRLALARGAQFVWLLNNDTVAPPDTLTQLVAAALQDPRSGVTGTVLRHMDRPGRVQAWGGGSLLRSVGYATHFLSPAALGPDSFLTFASVLLRRDLLEAIGLLDEGYFMYFEDTDFCFRAREAGWSLTVAPNTAVLHKEGANSGLRRNPRGDRIVTASGIRFLRRHGRPRVLAPWLFVLSRLAKRAARFDLAGFRAVLRGVTDWRRNTPAAFQTEGKP